MWNRSVRAAGDTMTGRLQTRTNDWSMVTSEGAGGLNSAPLTAPGSIHINDAYIRSVGLWLSQITSIANDALSKAAVLPTCGGYPIGWIGNNRHSSPWNGAYVKDVCTANGWMIVDDQIN